MASLPKSLLNGTPSFAGEKPTSPCTLSPTHEPSSLTPERYHGEASDIRFVKTMKLALHTTDYHGSPEPTRADETIDSYEQDNSFRPEPVDLEGRFLPNQQIARTYLDIYLSTIHIAYPFVESSQLSQLHVEFWKSDSLGVVPAPWLSILLTIFAIAACYESFSASEAESSMPKASCHRQYFEQALQIARRHDDHRSLEHVIMLLLQCFYLLATCQTDHCWNTLGLAVRIAQSLGLHVEDAIRVADGESPSTSDEHKRRIWYSLFILDRLLALQLGRPPAIHEGEFNVNLPSPIDIADSKKDLNKSETLTGHYFIAMVHFSLIIGRALRMVYSPHRTDLGEDLLLAMENLEQELDEWKTSLPRVLRFDLPQTFDSSVSFKRQRNMLAVKFHHLRALLNRPFLSPARFLRSSATSVTFYEKARQRIHRCQRRCVSAAQKTARLLHNVEDKKTLIYAFPWWQMISCLICASSILLVAPLCFDRSVDTEEIDWAAVEEDSDVCLTVFEALSTNNDAARMARDMMKSLKETSLGIQANAAAMSFTGGSSDWPSIATDTAAPGCTPVYNDPAYSNYVSLLGFDTQHMSDEISEPILWGAHVMNSAFNPFFNRAGPYG